MASERFSAMRLCRLSLNFAQVLEQLLLSWRAEPDAFNKGRSPGLAAHMRRTRFDIVFAFSIGV
jgi:hypothetical protein